MTNDEHTYTYTYTHTHAHRQTQPYVCMNETYIHIISHCPLNRYVFHNRGGKDQKVHQKHERQTGRKSQGINLFDYSTASRVSCAIGSADHIYYSVLIQKKRTKKRQGPCPSLLPKFPPYTGYQYFIQQGTNPPDVGREVRENITKCRQSLTAHFPYTPPLFQTNFCIVLTMTETPVKDPSKEPFNSQEANQKKPPFPSGGRMMDKKSVSNQRAIHMTLKNLRVDTDTTVITPPPRI